MHSGALLTSLLYSLYLLTKSSVDSTSRCLMLWSSMGSLMYFFLVKIVFQECFFQIVIAVYRLGQKVIKPYSRISCQRGVEHMTPATGCSFCRNTPEGYVGCGPTLVLQKWLFSSPNHVSHDRRGLARSGLFRIAHCEYFRRTQLYPIPWMAPTWNVRVYVCGMWSQNHTLWGVRVPIFIADSRCITEASSGSLLSVLLPPDHGQLVQGPKACYTCYTSSSALTLKEKLWKTLLNHEFDTSKIRGQSYDGASNMRGKCNGLQALVLKDCPYAYYVHCFAHRLQLALVAASKEVILVHQFFENLAYIINVVYASSKRHDELQKANVIETKRLLELGEIKSCRGANQARTLRRAGDTRWGSHIITKVGMIYEISCMF
nr:hypothetical protein [Tanacetum cinerariifolium]